MLVLLYIWGRGTSLNPSSLDSCFWDKSSSSPSSYKQPSECHEKRPVSTRTTVSLFHCHFLLSLPPNSSTSTRAKDGRVEVSSLPPRRPLTWVTCGNSSHSPRRPADTSAVGFALPDRKRDLWRMCSRLYLLDNSRNQRAPELWSQNLSHCFPQGTCRVLFITTKRGTVSDTRDMLHRHWQWHWN